MSDPNQPPFRDGDPLPDSVFPPADAYPATEAYALPPASAPSAYNPPSAGYPGGPASAPFTPPGYPSGPPAGYYAPAPQSSGLAVASLICGIGGLLFIWVWIPVAASIAAIVMGHISLGQIKRNPRLGGRGMALTGLILGYLGVGGVALLTLLVFLLIAGAGFAAIPFLAV